MTRLVLSALFAAAACADQLPITGIDHVTFRVSDMQKAAGFYHGVLGLPRNGPVFRVNETQFIQLEATLPAGGDARLDRIALATTDARELAQMLKQRGVAVEDNVDTIRVRDPDGNLIEFVEGARFAMNDSPDRISRRLLHAGIPVRADRLDAALAFYREKLGFAEFWRGGPRDSEIRWINLRMPGARGDYVELMLHDGSPSPQQRGSMEHICLEVADIQAAHRTLVERGIPRDDPRFQPRIGRNRRWQLNLFDPDGSRTELMESRQVPE